MCSVPVGFAFAHRTIRAAAMTANIPPPPPPPPRRGEDEAADDDHQQVVRSVSWKGYQWLTWLKFVKHCEEVEMVDHETISARWIKSREREGNSRFRGSDGIMEVCLYVTYPPIVVDNFEF